VSAEWISDGVVHRFDGRPDGCTAGRTAEPTADAERRGERPRLLVSACLVGLCTRYDGGHNRHAAVSGLGGRFTLVPVCPEQLGGLPTPRPPAEIQGEPTEGGAAEVVLACDGRDVSSQLHRGAAETLAVARLVGARAAVLKARSPSCGVHETYDGTFTGTLRPGSGVTAGLLRRAGLDLFTEEDIVAGRMPG